MKTNHRLLAAGALTFAIALTFAKRETSIPYRRRSRPGITPRASCCCPKAIAPGFSSAPTWVWTMRSATIRASSIRRKRMPMTDGLFTTSTSTAQLTITMLAPVNFPTRQRWYSSSSKSHRKEPRNIVTRGQFEGNRIALEVAVKDSSRPDGSKTPWAYYDFTGKPGPSGRDVRDRAKAKPDGSCYDCHKKHADVDNVWVQFYPTLRDLTKNTNAH